MWRWASGIPRIGPVDARAGAALLIFLLHMRLWTMGISLVGVAFFAILERFGLTVPVFFRLAKRMCAGPIVWPENPKISLIRFARDDE